jgi:mono/diheme cytochrome c family protein
MHLHSKFGWVRIAGLVAALGLGACDSGGETKDAKKVEPAKDVKAPEPVKTEPVKTEPVKTEPAPDVKAPDTVPPDAKAGETAGDAKAGETAGDTKAPDVAAPDTKTPEAKAPDKKGTPTKTDTKATTPAIDGKPLYEKHCKSCHALDGKGTEAMKKKNVPDLTDAGWQGKHSKAKIVDVLNKGIEGSPMKSFSGKMKPEEIDAVAAYVKKLK